MYVTCPLLFKGQPGLSCTGCWLEGSRRLAQRNDAQEQQSMFPTLPWPAIPSKLAEDTRQNK